MTRIVTYRNGKRKEPDFPAVLSYHNGRLTGFAAENVPDPTERPGATTFFLDALDSAIRLRIAKTALAQGYRYRIRRRNAADTAWENAQPWVDAGSSRTVTITQYSAMQAIENDRRYEVKVIAYNVIGDGTESAYQEVTPMVLQVPPDVPTFILATDRDSFSDIVITPSVVGTPNPPVSHWVVRHRVKGQTVWTTEAVAADQSSYTFSASRGQTIEFQLAARNSAGDSAFTATQEIRIIDVPDRPQIFLTARAGGFDVRSVSPPSGDMATGSAFRYREGTSGDWTNGTSLQVRGLEGETLYQVEGWLTNDAGRSLSAFATVTTLAAPVQAEGYLTTYGDSLVVYGDNLIVYGE